MQNKRYSIARVRKRFKEVYNCDIDRIDMGYKGYRYLPHIYYRIIDSTNNNILVEKTTLYELGKYLESQGEY